MNTVGQHAHRHLPASLRAGVHSLCYASLVTEALEKLGSHLGCEGVRHQGQANSRLGFPGL